MDPLDFLRPARDLSGSAQEAERRTSIGRSYFAVFNHIRIRLEPLKSLPDGSDIHSIVVRYLTFANDKQLQSVGQTLKDLRISRNEADYNMKAMIIQEQSRLALSKAEKALEKSRDITEATFTAAIRAQTTYR